MSCVRTSRPSKRAAEPKSEAVTADTAPQLDVTGHGMTVKELIKHNESSSKSAPSAPSKRPPVARSEAAVGSGKVAEMKEKYRMHPMLGEDGQILMSHDGRYRSCNVPPDEQKRADGRSILEAATVVQAELDKAYAQISSAPRQDEEAAEAAAGEEEIAEDPVYGFVPATSSPSGYENSKNHYGYSPPKATTGGTSGSGEMPAWDDAYGVRNGLPTQKMDGV